MNNNIVLCDECGKEFLIVPKVKQHGNGIEETYFNCGHCDHKYIAYVTDAGARKQRETVRKMYKRLEGLTSVDQSRSQLAKIKMAKAGLGKRMDRLKAEFNGE
ncbi:DNA-directed RNA polymerase subunit RPC12/RpoP [Virgibacillus halotolerans]|uniref:hypothetical protein n=1 Tax=Virgibacillus halotolerans TaxID=1071053 RepID=UPI00196100CC|nr:hypothetical protein [Virgibacillus halotolerans]MBM7598484.1 DNA-directed RNA polymerase subunit RPC12/RpoP [Virgibacillus halotolerans]